MISSDDWQTMKFENCGSKIGRRTIDLRTNLKAHGDYVGDQVLFMAFDIEIIKIVKVNNTKINTYQKGIFKAASNMTEDVAKVLRLEPRPYRISIVEVFVDFLL